MGTDAEDARRWRFFAQFHLALNRHRGICSVLFRQPPANPGLPPKWYPVAEGPTPDDAIDAAIARFEEKEARRRR